jgi:hypothetical protein
MTTSTAGVPRARHEERYLASEDLGRLALRTAGSHLPLAREDSPYQWLTTTYCDTTDWSVYRGAEADAAVRLRFREYHRTRPETILSSPRIWVELKEDVGDRWRKKRFEMASAEVPALLRGERRFPLDDEDLVKSAESLVARGARPVVVTQYNRLAYALQDDSVRVTADHNLIYLAVPWASEGDDAVTGRIGPVLGRERDVIIEVKWFDELPLWADELRQFLQQRAPTDRPSKFVMAMRHLLGVDVR